MLKEPIASFMMVTDSRIELVPTRRERLVRLIWPWGSIALLVLLPTQEGTSWVAAILLSIVPAGWGFYEYTSPRRLILGPWAFELVRFGKTRTVPWRDLSVAYPSSALTGHTATIYYSRPGAPLRRPGLLHLHYGYGHNPDDLAQLINDTRAAAVPNEPHPMPAEKLKRIDRWTLILLPLFVVGVGILMLALGLLD